MDNIFGKDDSGNESELVDIEDKDSPSRPSGTRDSDGMDIDDVPLKVKGNEPDTSSQNSQSDTEESSPQQTSSGMLSSDHMDLKNDPESQDEHEDIFGNDIMLPHSVPTKIDGRRESREKSKKELEEEEREKMQVLVSNFTEDQLDRYEMYRRAAFPKAAIKRIMQTITGCSVSQNVVIAMSGIAKVFVGEIVEEALDVMETHEETGPLQPKHLREAVRRLRLQGQIPNGRAHKAFFRL
ncbi:transcription initiation factor TFIID subunit 11 isoform X1 [Neodiprion virginianus]|uniref:transcription initiation factor TFIID subunit 11 isoform X1 n=1 Tax=Neodiprion fabricii TaxID=2872261 RepID=UPI001ED8CFAD|nr:transcription initiation factor TFIID subunit 11 isoform X1 [Neodiprion fabricii]XP_046605679.1 transcription initiation factor TFIID subunit 11 isoform X1 [Neodiprion virginianus]XP_046605680.1 transcription initiation factor TFIID subunit 11 isoform X1 [Neodiprion virginianus]